MKTQHERLIDWASDLDEDEVIAALLSTVGHLIEVGDVKFWSDYDYPIWDSTGERLED